jgi:hypothetical protein
MTKLSGVCVRRHGVSQSGAAGAPATQTGSPNGELRGRDRVKRPTIIRASPRIKQR